jgi:5-guanidino-2-oxopentanoate decarboxylase
MSVRPELSVGEALVGLLEAYGVDTIFGIPGVHNIEMYRALPRSKIRHILPRHEQGAGFMADGYARATGKPGVCFTISGPGVTNILTPMGQAWSDSSPMLVISTALDVVDSAQGRGRLHEMIDQLGAAKSVTNLAMRAYTAKDVQDCVARAFSAFSSSRPRPAYLEIPIDVLKQPAGEGWKKRSIGTRPTGQNLYIFHAAEKLSNAASPIIIIGGGADTYAVKELLGIGTIIGAPVLVTTAGKGNGYSELDKTWGYCLSDPKIQELIADSDCVLAVGTELSETDFWSDFQITKDLIRIDIDPNVLAGPHIGTINICGDAFPVLYDIGEQLKREKPASLPPKPDLHATTIYSGFIGILQEIRRCLPDNSVLVSDMTQIAYAANQLFPVGPGGGWIHPVGFGTLGFALPAAIGAKIGGDIPGHYSRPVACLVGDYGLQYTINELATAVEHKLPIPILLWNNDALGQIRDNMVEAGIQPNAVTLRNPDFQMLANAYGCHAAKPANLKELATAITAALNADGPTLIEMTPQMIHA